MIKSKELAAIEAGNITAVDLLNKYPATELVNDLMEIIRNTAEFEQLVKPSVNKIVVTEEQFKEFFRIRGLDVNGQPQTRGRKSKPTIKAED